MWGALPGLLRGGRTLYWYARGREAFTNRVTALALLLQLALGLWLIPVYGAAGAAAAALVGDVVALALLWRLW
jgi:O-antigen/teichoic acid export membrane protein